MPSPTQTARDLTASERAALRNALQPVLAYLEQYPPPVEHADRVQDVAFCDAYEHLAKALRLLGGQS